MWFLILFYSYLKLFKLWFLCFLNFCLFFTITLSHVLIFKVILLLFLFDTDGFRGGGWWEGTLSLDYRILVSFNFTHIKSSLVKASSIFQFFLFCLLLPYLPSFALVHFCIEVEKRKNLALLVSFVLFGKCNIYLAALWSSIAWLGHL